MTQQYSRDDLLEYLQRLTEELGHSPRIVDIRDRTDAPPVSRFKNEFGSWNAAKDAAGLTTFQQRGQGSYSDTELLDLLRQLDTELRGDGSVTKQEMQDADGYPSAQTYKRRFGSWNAAKEQAGLTTIAEDDTRPRYTDGELLAMLQDLAADLDRPLLKRDVEETEDYPDPTTFERRFGSWNAAKEQAGLTTIGKGETPRPDSYTDAELLDLLRQRAAEVTGTLTENAMDAAPDYPNSSTYRRRFGSWQAAKEKAGVQKSSGK
ncbi:hypothetical protein QA600_18545 [Natronococcus sp. A-GB1]|uniref:homing endonuclease associated repeat-containing protein n=1 Tax=Natronococcus sp. A-GB1 TaxID=3037648 RepID=UPI00241F8CBD|nr:hypothetical protein [Natronococcus sp. A-GB1]MDG5761333.1 hypothetical protein [Natronococcus sp. A-GB1]